MRNPLKSTIKKLPILSWIVSKRDRLRSDLAQYRKSVGFFPPGHFYSPIPSLDDVRRDEARIFSRNPTAIPGVDLNTEEQLALLRKLAQYYDELPFKPMKLEGLRYYYENPAYSYCDAILLHSMLRFLKPHRVIEVGSGYSSCMTLDTNDLHFGGSIDITFIEPYPDLLKSLVEAAPTRNFRVLTTRLQDVDLSEFEKLEANDILFIDSTHVSKIGSDVNFVFFEVLPRLSRGVYIHFHDVFYPFEYPKAWVYKGIAWNETYLLRAFLQYNEQFRVVLMSTYVTHFCEEFIREQMPLCMKNPGGSIWIRKE